MILQGESEQTATQTEIPKLLQPRDHKARVVIWADLSVDNVDRLNESLNVDHNKQVLADIFHLDAWREDPQQAIVMDLYYYTIQFARENNFNREKISAFFSIMKKTHEVCIETPFGNLDQTFRYFKELVLCHAINRPPHSLELFNAEEVRKISEYAINTYFRHFKLYKCAFTPLVRLDLTISYEGLSVSPPPPEIGDHEEETQSNKESASIDQGGDVIRVLEGETEQVADSNDPSPESEEADARKELRAMIQNFLAEEIKKLKMGVDEQMKTTEEILSKKIEAVEGPGTKKTGRDSAKRKK